MGTRRFMWFWLSFMVIWTVTPVSGTRLIRRSVEDLTIRSSMVLTGKVTQIESRWNDQRNQIYTDITVEIESFLKGSHEEGMIVIRQLGGRVGDTAMSVFGSPTFNKDERVLLFLKPRPGTTDRIVVAGLAQGKFHLDTDPLTGEIAAENEFEGRVPLSSIRDRIRLLLGE